MSYSPFDIRRSFSEQVRSRATQESLPQRGVDTTMTPLAPEAVAAQLIPNVGASTESDIRGLRPDHQDESLMAVLQRVENQLRHVKRECKALEIRVEGIEEALSRLSVEGQENEAKTKIFNTSMAVSRGRIAVLERQVANLAVPRVERGCGTDDGVESMEGQDQ